MAVATKRNFHSSQEMLDWQYRMLLSELQQLQTHAEDPTCPCTLKDMNEYCLAKHSLSVFSLASETASMDDRHAEMLFDLAEDATELHKKLREHVCGHGDDVDVVSWSRQWRKKIEPIYYSCKVKMAEETLGAEDVATMFAPQIVTADDIARMFENKSIDEHPIEPLGRMEVSMEDISLTVSVSCKTDDCRVRVNPKRPQSIPIYDKTVPISQVAAAIREARDVAIRTVPDTETAPPPPSATVPVPQTEQLPPAPAKAEPLPEIDRIAEEARKKRDSFNEYLRMLRYEPNTTAYEIENDAFLTVPIYESHSRGKNWAAIVTLDPKSPGGLRRTFLSRAHGNYIYNLDKLSPGDAIEFGADYYTGVGHKRENRRYGIVAAITTDKIYLTKTQNARSAIKLSEEVKPIIDFAQMRMEESQIPQSIDLYGDTIVKHYRAAKTVHSDSIRVKKLAKGVLVYLGCPVKASWNGAKCGATQVIIKSVVPRADRYEQELQALRRSHPGINVKFHTDEGIEAHEPELEEVKEAMKTAEVVE